MSLITSLLVPLGLGYILLRSVYRIWVHPLSKFPGPKLAAITHGYEFYYDVLNKGTYIWQIEKMHEEYGPIVRFNPRELHIKDAHSYEIIHARGIHKRDKDPLVPTRFVAPGSTAGTIGHEHHRLRREYINNFFSKQAVMRMEHVIQDKVDKMAQRFEDAHLNSTVVPLHIVFGAMAADVVTQYCFGTPLGISDNPDFNNPISESLNELTEAISALRFFPLLLSLVRKTPSHWLQWVSVQTRSVLELQNWIRSRTAECMGRAAPTNGLDSKDQCSRGTILDALMASDVPAEEKRPDRLEDEIFVLVNAGMETTARSLAVTFFHLAKNEETMLELRRELKQLMPFPTSPATWLQLEKLAYLNGVINEGLRLSYGLTSRSSRSSPNEPMAYLDYSIPPGTPVSQSNYFVLMDPNIFPDPETFDPDRWTRAAANGENLEKFLVSFGKGTRNCVGMNLAYAELYTTIATVARRFDLELHQTTLDSVRMARDISFAWPKEGEFSVKVKVTRVLRE